MVQTKRKGGSKKRLLTFRSLTSSLNPRAKTFSPKNKKRLPALKALTSTLNPGAKTFSQKKNRLPVFKLLTSGLSPATRILLRKPKSRKKPLNILEVASRLRLNANAKTYSQKKVKGSSKKRKGRKH